jgi:hypothetical protein
MAEPRFKPKCIGIGLTPITWQGWCVTFLLMIVLSVSVYAVTYLVSDPLDVVIVLLILISIELTVFILFGYRHAKSFDDAEKDEATLLARKREKVEKDLAEWKRRNNL